LIRRTSSFLGLSKTLAAGSLRNPRRHFIPPRSQRWRRPWRPATTGKKESTPPE
jgi:hypothetical protein